MDQPLFILMSNMAIPWQIYFSAVVFAWGACWGSFFNVCIYRIPRNLSVVHPRSHCPRCQKPIAWYDNLPILSFLILRARCRQCGTKISCRYVLVELLTAVLFLLVWLKFGRPWDPRPLGLAPVASLGVIFSLWLVVSGLIVGTFIDLERMILPDRITWGGIALGLVLSGVWPELHAPPSFPNSFPIGLGLMRSLEGAALGFGLLWAVAVIGRMIFKRDAMGFGDVKLLGAIGAFLGWQAVLFTVMISSFAGSLVGLSLVLSRKKKMQSRIPYGPYLALAALIWLLWGQTLWQAYIGFLMP